MNYVHKIVYPIHQRSEDPVSHKYEEDRRNLKRYVPYLYPVSSKIASFKKISMWLQENPMYGFGGKIEHHCGSNFLKKGKPIDIWCASKERSDDGARDGVLEKLLHVSVSLSLEYGEAGSIQGKVENGSHSPIGGGGGKTKGYFPGSKPLPFTQPFFINISPS
ncbi:hypothetical protein L2E82_03825 [Cichorium intybus]|uniref:Uncharacterized protein n=1 Tax=Cichorium intybus TaxID=13427 RepID=A0ACB9H6P4_CICIN|nr:hypothetical protein L2E82_03825 [Cichorium intybus]